MNLLKYSRRVGVHVFILHLALGAHPKDVHYLLGCNYCLIARADLAMPTLSLHLPKFCFCIIYYAHDSPYCWFRLIFAHSTWCPK